jgi:hypothetical protein
MVTTEHYDVVVLGSGEAGKYLSWHMSAIGKRTLMIERRYIGGSCPNIACLPSKNVIHSAKVVCYAHRVAEFGVSAGTSSTDMAAVPARKRAMVGVLWNIHLRNFQRNGTEIAIGEGHFVDERTIEISFADGTVRRVQGDSVIVSTGSRAKLDEIRGLTEAQPLTHIEALEVSYFRNNGSGTGVIVVQDDGPGIPAGQEESICEPFVTLPGKQDEVAAGSGLGLAIARRAVSANGGKIYAQSASRAGLAVTIEIPTESIRS